MKPVLHRGKIAKAPKILAVRALTREDLARLKTAERTQPRVKGFRETHHRLARLVASGLPNEDILRITGFSYQRLWQLRQDPSFQELISNYRGKVDEAFTKSQDEFYETSTSNMLRAERQIEEHLDRADEVGELIPIKTLLSITSDRADRFGYSKKTINANVNVDYARELERTMASRGQSTVIDAEVTSPTPSLIPKGPPPDSPSGTNSAAVPAGFRRRM